MAWRIGVAGVRRGSGLVASFQNHPACEVTTVCDLNAERVETYAREHNVPHTFTDYSEFCQADLDAIVVATPAPLHVKHVVEALGQGKHVLSEVPAIYTYDEAAQLAQAVRASGRQYMFAENMCYFAWVQTYRAMVERGDLGEIIYAEGEYIHCCESLMSDEDGNPTWRASLPPIQYCTHDLGPILQMLGDRVVTAVGMKTGSHRFAQWGTIDIEVGLFTTAKGRVIKQLCGFAVAKEPAHHWFCLYGTKGEIESPRTPGGKHLLWSENIPHLAGQIELPLSTNHPQAPPQATAGGHGTSEYYMVDDFVRCMKDGGKPAIDVHDAINWSLPGICAHLSAENGSQPITVPDPLEL